MSDLQPNDLVDITIKGARVRMLRSEDGSGVVWLSYDVGGYVTSVPLAESVTVERLAPAEWPPRLGDVWRMRSNGRYVCVRDFDGRAGYQVALIDVRTGERFMPHELMPEELLYREDDKAGPYVHLIGERVAVHTDDYERVTGVLTDAKPHGITVRVDHVINGVPHRDFRSEDIARVVRLDAGENEQDGGA